jgi:replicative DNA helicase
MPDNNFFTLNDIQMPYSMESEQAVLGCILSDPSCLNQVAIILNSDAFFMPQHKNIFNAMLTLDSMGSKIDPLVVLNMLVENGTFDSNQGKQYLLDLAQSVPTTQNVEMYAKIVKEKYYIRQLISISSETIESAVNQKDTADVLLDSAEQKIYDIRKGKVSNAPSKLGDVILNDVYQTLKNLTGEDAEKYKGYTTGFSDLDNILTGLNRSDLIIVGARPAMGKTSFALNLARNVSVIAKRKVLFFSLEMTKEQLAMRVLGTESGVSSKKMRSGQISPNEWKEIGEATSRLSSAELYFDDTSGITVPEMKAKARRLGAECIMIDYLGLVTSSVRAENRVNELEQITKSLKAMAKDLNVPIICLAQLARGTEERGKSHKPQLSDLRGSGSIEQDADIVLMLYREDYYKGEKEKDDNGDQPAEINKVSVIVTKNRHGSTGEVEFAWDGERTQFKPIERNHDEY